MEQNIRRIISSAIQTGAPLYNRGDIPGCCMLYRRVADQVLMIPALQAEHRRKLTVALQSRGEGVKRQAWLLRHAFDDILAQHVPTHSKVASSLPSDIASMIRATIQMGAPLYNSGDVSGCERCYRQTARSLSQASGVPQSYQDALRRALNESNNTDRAAWTFRCIFDSLLQLPPPASTEESKGVSTALTGNLLDHLLWTIVNDSVMGGRSSSTMRQTSGGYEFKGNMILQGGGFASVRGQSDPRRLRLLPASSTGVKVTVAGDGNRYKLTMKCASQPNITWQADFLTRSDSITTHALSFSSFVPSWRGRVVPSEQAGRLHPSQAISIGVMLSKLTDTGRNNPEIRDGAFSLLIKDIQTF